MANGRILLLLSKSVEMHAGYIVRQGSYRPFAPRAAALCDTVPGRRFMWPTSVTIRCQEGHSSLAVHSPFPLPGQRGLAGSQGQSNPLQSLLETVFSSRPSSLPEHTPQALNGLSAVSKPIGCDHQDTICGDGSFAGFRSVQTTLPPSARYLGSQATFNKAETHFIVPWPAWPLCNSIVDKESELRTASRFRKWVLRGR